MKAQTERAMRPIVRMRMIAMTTLGCMMAEGRFVIFVLCVGG